MRPLSESTTRVTSKNFEKKYIALGRIVNQWDQIMGANFADKAQPIKINYRKQKDKKIIRLDIATSAANATTLAYQKDLILQRINQIFGDNFVNDIKFIVSPLPQQQKTLKKQRRPLTDAQKNDLSRMLEGIDDEAFREKLENLGQAIYQDES